MQNELLGIDYLRNKLATKEAGVRKRYAYYDMKNRVRDHGISTPPELRRLETAVAGWNVTAVDELANRIMFLGFGYDPYNMAEIYEENNGDILFDDSMLSALISSCSFIYLFKDEDEKVRMQVIDGGNATGDIDTVTKMLKEGYAVLSRDEKGNVLKDAYFEPYKTTYYDANGSVKVVNNPCKYPLLVPIINRPHARRPFGRSVITRSCMSITDSAMRTLKRSEISAEFYSFPQKYIVGLAQNSRISDKWSAAISAMLTISKDKDGDTPHVGQFAQQSMVPHIDHLKMYASMFAGQTGLTMDDLGFSLSNPSSYDAIKASHTRLDRTAKKTMKSFAIGFKNAGLVGACLRDDIDYDRADAEIEKTRIKFEPLYSVDPSTFAAVADGIYKLNEAVDGYVTKETVRELTGLEGGEN